MTTGTAFTFVIPTHNEAAEIRATLEAATRQTHAGVEIIVVDDGSTDGTLEILREWQAAGCLRVLEQSRAGAAAARNAGMDAASGDVVVFVDADVRVPPDFLEQLAAVYEAGADFVSVESRVENQDSLVGRFQQATHEAEYDGLRNVGYSQAFSCRADAAREARFPAELPGCGGEDGEFFLRLERARLRLSKAPWIVVDHRVPDTVRTLWAQSRGRGRVVPYVDHRLHGRSLRGVVVRRALGSGKSALSVATVVPALAPAARRARCSPRGLRDLPSFLALYVLTLAAQRSGEWSGLRRLIAEDRRA